MSSMIKEPTAAKSAATTKERHTYKILSPKAVINIPKYQYNGVDRSLIYKYILSPLAGVLVERFTPPSLAPNTITLFGLSLMFMSYLNVYYHCPTIDHCSIDEKEPEVPGYIFLINGMAILIYQTLDNMDGKQARKTGSSSPLGLLFDHGCDAINPIFGSITWICAFGLESSPLHYVHIYIMVFMPMLLFYVATWEEYYTHKLDLPIFNGPSEGLLLAATVNFIAWWYGRSFWYGTEFYDFLVSCCSSIPVPETMVVYMERLIGGVLGSSFPIQNYNMIVLATIVSGLRELFAKTIGVVRVYGIRTIKNLAPVAVLLIWSFLIVKEDDEVFQRNERKCFHLVALLFVEMVTKLMLDHISGEEFKPFRKTLVPLFSLYTITIFGNMTYHQIDLYISIYTWTVFAFLAMNVKTVIKEICDLLGIWCFDIVTPRKKFD